MRIWTASNVSRDSLANHCDGRGILVSEYFSHPNEVWTPGVRIIEAQLYCEPGLTHIPMYMFVHVVLCLI